MQSYFFVVKSAHFWGFQEFLELFSVHILHKYLDFNINYALIHPMISKWILKKETCYHLLQLTRFTSNFH